VSGLPDRVSVDIDYLEALPLPELNGPRQKRMGVQVDHLDSVGECQVFE